MKKNIIDADPEIYAVLKEEFSRQNNTLGLIASENYVSNAVLEAAGSILTNKYSEGYPKKRYYAGNKVIDISEEIAIKRAKKLFNCDHANVQPHSGSQANLAAYMALLNLGDKILAMDLAQGGHLTHGSKVNFSGKLFNFIHYGVNRETEKIDYDAIRDVALKEKPRMIVCGATAYPRIIDFKKFKEIADEIGAYLLADIAHIAGLIIAGLHPDPAKYADVITTTTHKTLRGPRGAIILCKAEYAEKIDKAVFPGMQGGPLDHIIAAKAVAFKEALQPEFKDYQKQIVKNSKFLAEVLIDEDFRLISGGTDNHLILADLTNKMISGNEAQELLEEVNIVVNKNMIPFDNRKPLDPSGIRIGTPAATTRGLKEREMKVIGSCISRAIKNKENKIVLRNIKREILDICEKFPIPYNIPN